MKSVCNWLKWLHPGALVLELRLEQSLPEMGGFSYRDIMGRPAVCLTVPLDVETLYYLGVHPDANEAFMQKLTAYPLPHGMEWPPMGPLSTALTSLASNVLNFLSTQGSVRSSTVWITESETEKPCSVKPELI